MYKEKGEENKDYERKNISKDEKIIIRLKRKRDEVTIPSIFVKNSSRKIGSGHFYKHVETVLPHEIEKDDEKNNLNFINLMLKHEQNQPTTLVKANEIKENSSTLQIFEDELNDLFNNLKKYKVKHEDVQYVDFDGRKRKFKIIDIDSFENNNLKRGKFENTQIEGENGVDLFVHKSKEEEEEEAYSRGVCSDSDEESYQYDMYILDEHKIQLKDYIDSLFSAKANCYSEQELILLDDIYRDNEKDYMNKMFGSSYSVHSSKSSCTNNESFKDLSDYPDEPSPYEMDYSKNSEDYNEQINTEEYEDSDGFPSFSDVCRNTCDDCRKIRNHQEYFHRDPSISESENGAIESDEMNKFENDIVEEIEEESNRSSCSNYVYLKKTYKTNSSEEVEYIRDELVDHFREKNMEMQNVSLSDKLKILEQMEIEFQKKNYEETSETNEECNNKQY